MNEEIRYNLYMEKSNSYLRIRNFLGTLGCLLPVLCIMGAFLSPNKVYPDWWTSISITYYSSPVLIAILSAVSIFLILYRGYNIWDTAAFILFIMLALNSILLFSKSDNVKKNRIYKICGWIILGDLMLFALNALFFHLKWTVIVNETVMLFAFGISWLVKGHIFDKFFGITG